MRGRLLKVFMVVLVLIPVGLTAYLANSLYHRKGVPEALEDLTKQLFKSKEEERKAAVRAEELERKTAELQTAYDSLVADLKGEVDSREIRVKRFREKLEINFVDKVLFDSGSADITPRGRDILAKVAGVLGKVKDKSIYVVGHTDNMPIHSSLYPSNWELSSARASSVIRFLSEAGNLSPERFTAMGRAFYQPLASNASSDGRQENRRVEVIVTEVPLLEGEGGFQAMRGTVSNQESRPPSGRDLTPAGPAAPQTPAEEQPVARAPEPATSPAPAVAVEKPATPAAPAAEAEKPAVLAAPVAEPETPAAPPVPAAILGNPSGPQAGSAIPAKPTLAPEAPEPKK